jgi:hypothetical protein
MLLGKRAFASVILTVALPASAALAECAVTQNFNWGGFTCGAFGCRGIIAPPSPLISIINTVNTAFLTNTTSFVSAPGGPRPDQTSGGVWSRVIAGEVDSKSTSVQTVRPGHDLGGPFGDAAGQTTCSQTSHQEYVGYQVGADLGKLNIGSSGANLHFGVTGGNFYAKAEDTTPGNFIGYTGKFEVPFVGLYTAFTQGNFFADAQVRWDFYQNSSTSNLYDYHGVKNDARGFSVTGNVGYRLPFAGNWFVEPSAGVVWSRVEVDPVALLAESGFVGEGSIVRINDITSVLGRASLRLGANFTEGIYTWQPFVTATVVREFAGKVHSTAEFKDPTNALGFDGIMFDTTTTRMGTYAQVGLGSAIVIGNTGWLGYGRGDVKFGDNIEGFGVNVGLRYQW